MGWGSALVGVAPYVKRLAPVLVIATVGCATRAAMDMRVDELGPGGVPRSCRLPDCAIPGEFADIDSAALAGLGALKEIPDYRRREYSGCVFEERPGVYRASYAGRLTNDVSSLHHCVTPPAPRGTKKVAEFHNHPNRERFTMKDILGTAYMQYILAPSGNVYRYDPLTRINSRWQAGQWVPVERWRGDEEWAPM